MDDVVEFDPVLAGFWPVGRGAGYEPEPDGEGRAAWLETKAEASPVAEMQALLNAMTGELRQQFDMFQKIRAQAAPRLDGEEAEARIAKADAKAAVDALSLITRTMEKIDGLQRGLADSIARAAEETVDDAAYRSLLAGIEHKIAERAEERAHVLLAEWTAGAAGETGPPGPGAKGGRDADAETGGGEDRA